MAGRDTDAGQCRRASGGIDRGAPRLSNGASAPGRDPRPRRQHQVRHQSSLLARSPGEPGWSPGAGPGGACRRRGPRGKSDASRGRGSAADRRAGDRGDRGALRGSAGAAGRPHGDCGRGLPAATGDCNRRGRDPRTDRGRRAAGTTGTPASGGSPRSRGPGAIGWAVDKGAGVCHNKGRPPTPPRGGVCPRVWRVSARPSSFFPPGSQEPTRKSAMPPLSAAECSDFYTIT